jgi:hypothetical protein
MRRFALIALALSAACSRSVQVGTGGSAPAASRDVPITSPDQLLSAMQARYAGKWYRNLTFIQKTSFIRPDGSTSRTETWYEAAALPGKLRIDLGELSKKNGALYRNDSLYQVQEGKVTLRQKARNPLLILGFDAYTQPSATTMRQLREEGFNVTVLRTDTLYGKRVYVVGAGPGDSTSNQFWVEADRLLFVRMIQTNPANRRTQDVRFEKYVAHAGGWVAEEVRFLVGGRMVLHEAYSNVKVNVPLDENLFVAEKWATATHWYKP